MITVTYSQDILNITLTEFLANLKNAGITTQQVYSAEDGSAVVQVAMHESDLLIKAGIVLKDACDELDNQGVETLEFFFDSKLCEPEEIFVVLEAFSAEKLSAKVKSHLLDGWALHGSTLINVLHSQTTHSGTKHQNRYSQAMVKG